jgi:hypothetical protein
MTGRKVTRDDLRQAAEKYKNWGKWGPDDEIGTLNYTQAEDIVAAAKLVKKGKVISLALNFDNSGHKPARPLIRRSAASIRCTPCCAPAPTPIPACSTSAASAPPTTWW